CAMTLCIGVPFFHSACTRQALFRWPRRCTLTSCLSCRTFSSTSRLAPGLPPSSGFAVKLAPRREGSSRRAVRPVKTQSDVVRGRRLWSKDAVIEKIRVALIDEDDCASERGGPGSLPTPGTVGGPGYSRSRRRRIGGRRGRRGPGGRGRA